MSNPTDLTSKSWNKLKGLTVPKTGFGAKLDAYQAARKKTEELPTRNAKSYETAAAALSAITAFIPTAQGKCNKTLHKDTIAALGAYKGLVDKEGGKLHQEFAQYHGYVDQYKSKREVCGKEMTAIEQRMDSAAKALIATVERQIAARSFADAATDIKAGQASLAKIQKEADDSIAKPRIPGPAAETPHLDDRPDASVFTALIDKQKNIIAIRTNAEHDLATMLKEALTSAKGGK